MSVPTSTVTRHPYQPPPAQPREEPPRAGPPPAGLPPADLPGAGKQDDRQQAEEEPRWLRRMAVTTWMNTLIAAVVAATWLTAGLLAGHPEPAARGWGSWALRLFAVWCLSFLPGWMYVRFLDLRAHALWSEYILNLYRLGWDEPRYLPRPPKDSAFYVGWKAMGGSARPDNIYRQKFVAYYGREAANIGEQTELGEPREGGRLSKESLFPVFLATAVLAVGWAATLWNIRFLTDPGGTGDVLKYGFLGAYAFVISMLIRRYFQSDLRPSAYATVVYRIIFVLLIVAVLDQALSGSVAEGNQVEMAVAFMIGFFPLVGLQFLQRLTARALSWNLPRVNPDYPLDQLDGLNLWYEARLTEEGVEDMQNLTTMNLVDVILHTRVPPGRLVDWTDQAFLYIHLEQAGRRDLKKLRQAGAGPRPEAGGSGPAGAAPDGATANGATVNGAGPDSTDSHGGATARLSLRRVGIRTATDLLKAFSKVDQGPDGTCRRIYCQPPGVSPPLPPSQLRLLVKVLAQEQALNPVWNWQRNGVKAHRD